MRIDFLSTLLFLVLIVVGAFGFFAFTQGAHGGHFLCLTSVIFGADCPPAFNSLISVEHHLSGWRALSQAAADFWPAWLGWLAVFGFTVLFSLIGGLLLLGDGVSGHFAAPAKATGFLAQVGFLTWMVFKYRESFPDLVWARSIA